MSLHSSRSFSSQPLRWGILGTGAIAKTFARGVHESKTGALTAVGSRSSEGANRFADEFQISHRHASYEALLDDPKVEAIYIATPHPYHAEWALRIAEAGKYILCEKPLTLNHGEAMQVVQAAHSAGVLLMEAFMYRCHPQTAKIVELLRDGAVGQVQMVEASFGFRAGFNPQSRLFNPELGGGSILDVGCYPVSMARLITGAASGQDFAEPISVVGQGRVGETGVDEIAAAILTFPSGLVAQVATGVTVTLENTVRIFGSEGQILVPSPWMCEPTDGSIKIIVNGREIVIEVDRGLYAYEADAFAESVAQGRVASPAMSAEDALGNIKVLDEWRQAVGVVYETEKAEQNRPLRGSLRRLNAAPMSYGSVAGLAKPISRLVMGCDNQETFSHGAAMWDDFWEQGGNCFDTGHIYGGGLQERLLGQWLQNRGVRKEAVIIGKGAHTPNCNPEALSRQLLQSLERLGVDGVDIYMMHRDNPQIPVGEFVDVLNQHHTAGRMRAFGGSNWSIERVQQANDYAKQHGLIGFSVVSNNFSLARMVDPVWDGCVSASDVASRDWLERTQTALFAWSSQARGFFVRGDRDFTTDLELVRCWYSEDNFARLERARGLAKRRNTSTINIAAAYVLNQPFPVFALVGPRRISETHSSLGALALTLTAEECAWLNLESGALV
jgi:predicted dehydrogenase/aryl-alcohol dehydrogenase-like predicted oxidoreductase